MSGRSFRSRIELRFFVLRISGFTKQLFQPGKKAAWTSECPIMGQKRFDHLVSNADVVIWDSPVHTGFLGDMVLSRTVETLPSVAMLDSIEDFDRPLGLQAWTANQCR